MAVLRFIARQWLALVLILAMATSSYIAVDSARDEAATARAVAAQVRTKAIEVCANTSGSAALVVAFKERVAQAAKDRGESENAEDYRALARGGADLIPLPADAQSARDTIGDLRREGDHYVLGDKALALVKRGCVEAYNPNADVPRQDAP